MNTTTHLARHILRYQPNKDAARLCLYHYLIHHCKPETPLVPQIFDDFAREALSFDFWRKKRGALSQELQFILQHYNETYALNWSFQEFSFPDNWQVISLDSQKELVSIIESWAQKSFPKESRNRIFRTQRGSYVVIVQLKEGPVDVYEIKNDFLIRDGQLEPLNTANRLRYGPNLELLPDQVQRALTRENSVCRFAVKNGVILGRVIQGFVFKESQPLQGAINQYPLLFYPIKELEQFFVDRQSDPTYQELVHTIEKALELIRLRHPEAENFSKAALQRGQSALRALFKNDNTLDMLVRDLSTKIRLGSETLDL